MKRWLGLVALSAGLAGCGSDPSVSPGGGYRVGDMVDVDGDGRADGKAVDDDGDGAPDGVDTNADGRSDRPLPGGPALTDSAMPIVVDSGTEPQPQPTDAAVVKPDVAVIPDGTCAAIEKEADLVRPPVDIVVALDTSGSMAPQVCNVSTNLTKFADNVGATTRVAAVYQMGFVLGTLTTALCGVYDPLAATALSKDAARYLHVNTEVDSNNALSALIEQFPTYSKFLRPGSPTHFLVVSDDESRPMQAPAFKTEMERLLGHPFYFHAIVADGQNLCLGAAVGTQYLTLADMTMGQKLSLCEQDWSVLFKKLEEAVAASAPLPCEFDVPPAPTGQTFNKNEVSVVYTAQGGSAAPFPRAKDKGACADKQGWHYDSFDQPKRIEFCPAACTQVRAGGKIAIAFGCQPPVILE
jgi:hypothetical protein